jgi:hypothetical protein
MLLETWGANNINDRRAACEAEESNTRVSLTEQSSILRVFNTSPFLEPGN